MKYIGDLSARDAEVLTIAASGAKDILEFGCGASTQILAQAMGPDAFLVSLDTSDDWIRRTYLNLMALGVPDTIYRLDDYAGWQDRYLTDWGLIFVDGIDSERGVFAKAAFPRLAIGGAMLFHDTRRPQDLKNVLELAMEYGNEISDVMLNVNGSNISVVVKKAFEPYENWNVVEGRSDWMTGAVPPPANWPELLP
jgi:predicted O-methyltransferase YrrM